jgi:putative membrane protein
MWQPQTFTMALLAAAAFGIVGIVLMMLGFKAFHYMTPRIDIQKELAEHHNMAVALVISSILLGIAILLHAVLAA